MIQKTGKNKFSKNNNCYFGFSIKNIVHRVFFAERKINHKNKTIGNSKKTLLFIFKIGILIFRIE